MVRSSSMQGLALTVVSLLTAASAAKAANLAGSVKIDGSSTVYPITEAIAEDFQKEQKDIRVTVGAAGTGAGYKKFCAGETDISGGSRGIKPDEVQKCKANGIEFMELPVAIDGLTVVVNPKNTFVKTLSFAQLKKIWEPGSTVKTWKDIDPSWPNQAIKLFGPSSEHGTFDYFTEEVVGKAKSSRNDYSAASDTNTLVNGVAGDANALGYFGYAYYAEAKNKLRAVPVSRDAKTAAIAPEAKSIEDGSYPLSRPLFLTVSKKAAERPEVDAFVKYYLKNVNTAAKAVGYSPLPQSLLEKSVDKYTSRKTGAWEQAQAH